MSRFESWWGDVEVGQWQTGCEGGACIAAMKLPKGAGVALTDTVGGATLYFTNEEWRRFTTAVKEGKFD